MGEAIDHGGATDLDLEWYVNYELHSGSVRDLIGTAPAFSWTASEVLPSDFCGGATFTIELEVTNPDGAVGVDTVDIDILVIC